MIFLISFKEQPFEGPLNSSAKRGTKIQKNLLRDLGGIKFDFRSWRCATLVKTMQTGVAIFVSFGARILC